MKKKTQKVISALLLSIMCIIPLLSNITVYAEEKNHNQNETEEIEPLEIISLRGEAEDENTFHIHAKINNDIDNGLIQIYLFERDNVFTQEDLYACYNKETNSFNFSELDKAAGVSLVKEKAHSKINLKEITKDGTYIEFDTKLGDKKENDFQFKGMNGKNIVALPVYNDRTEVMPYTPTLISPKGNTSSIEEQINKKDNPNKEEPYVSHNSVLYNDGTLILNISKKNDYARKHNGVKEDYLLNLNSTNFTKESETPWYNEKDLIKEVIVDNELNPISVAFWFAGCDNLEKINFENMMYDNLKNANNMIKNIKNVSIINFYVTNMNSLILEETYKCKPLVYPYINGKFAGNTFEDVINEVRDIPVDETSQEPITFAAVDKKGSSIENPYIVNRNGSSDGSWKEHDALGRYAFYTNDGVKQKDVWVNDFKYGMYYIDSTGVTRGGGLRWSPVDGEGYSYMFQSSWSKAYKDGKYVDRNPYTLLKDVWVDLGGEWRYAGSDGKLLVRWQFINGNWYYFDNLGRMLTGTQYSPEYDEWFYFDYSGAMQKNTNAPDGTPINGSGFIMYNKKNHPEWYFPNKSMALNNNDHDNKKLLESKITNVKIDDNAIKNFETKYPNKFHLGINNLTEINNIPIRTPEGIKDKVYGSYYFQDGYWFGIETITETINGKIIAKKDSKGSPIDLHFDNIGSIRGKSVSADISIIVQRTEDTEIIQDDIVTVNNKKYIRAFGVADDFINFWARGALQFDINVKISETGNPNNVINEQFLQRLYDIDQGDVRNSYADNNAIIESTKVLDENMYYVPSTSVLNCGKAKRDNAYHIKAAHSYRDTNGKACETLTGVYVETNGEKDSFNTVLNAWNAGIDFYLSSKNLEAPAYIQIQKVSERPDLTDSNTEFSLEGAEYRVYKSEQDARDNKHYSGFLTTDKNGLTNKVEFNPGTYYIKESKPSKGFGLDTRIYPVNVERQKTAIVKSIEPIKVTAGFVKLIKSSNRPDITDDNPKYSLEGAKYGVYKTDDSLARNPIAELVTLADGTTNTVKLEVGNYYIKEIQAPTGFELDATKHPITVTKAHTEILPLTVKVTDAAIIQDTYIKLHKDSAEPDVTNGNDKYSLAGAVYGIYNTKNVEVGTLTTNSNGDSQLLKIEPGNYKVKEKVAPKGYKIDPNEYTIEVTYDNVYDVPATITVEDIPVKDSYVYVLKAPTVNDCINGNPEYTLAGAEYGIYTRKSDAMNNKNAIGKFVTDSTGMSNKIKVDSGTYYVKETKAPAAFYIDKTVHEVVINEGETKAITSNEPPKMDPVGIFLKKHDANTGENIALGDGSLAGAEYTVKYYQELLKDPNTNPETVGKKPVRTWVFRTNKNGFTNYSEKYKVSGPDLYYNEHTGKPSIPIGTITIEETKAPKGYHLNPEIYVRQFTLENIDKYENENIPTYNIPVQPERSYQVNIVKKLDGTDIPIPDVEFTHVKPDGTTEKVVTDKDGKAGFFGLAEGTHEIYESGHPFDVLVNKAKVTFKVEKGVMTLVSNTSDASNTILFNVVDNDGVMTVYDKPNTFSLDITKVNENNKKLKGAEFTIFANKECTEEVDRQVSNEQGILTFKGLALNHVYYLRETKAPDGYRLPQNKDGSDVVMTVEIRDEFVNHDKFGFYLNGKYVNGNKPFGYGNVSIVNDVIRTDITVENLTSVRLPETGTSAGLFIMIIGLSLMGTAMVVYEKKTK